MTDTVVCTNCGLTYSTKENDLCSHCNFTNKPRNWFL